MNAEVIEAMRRALSWVDGTVEPWADHHYRAEAEEALRILDEQGFIVRPSRRKLTEAQASDIRARRAAGEGGRALAAEFGVTEQFVCDIYQGRRHA